MMNNIIINNKSTFDNLKETTTMLLYENYKHCKNSNYSRAAELYYISHEIIENFFNVPGTTQKEYNIKDLKEALELIKQDYLFCRENEKRKAAAVYLIIINLLSFIMWFSIEL